MNTDGKKISQLSDCLTVMEDMSHFCKNHGDTIPALISFWILEAASAPRVCFLGPLGAGITDLFRVFTDAVIDEDLLRTTIAEAGNYPESHKCLLPDGRIDSSCDMSSLNEFPPGSTVKLYHGNSLRGFKVSAALVGSSPSPDFSAEIWLERVALPVLISPANAALGTYETNFARSLKRKGMPFFVIISGIWGETQAERQEFIKELQKYKVTPLIRELGEFPLFFLCTDDDSEPDRLKEAVSTWVSEHGEKEHLRQMSKVVSAWVKELELLWQQRVSEEEKTRRLIDSILQHLNQQLARFKDIVAHSCMALENQLYRLYEDVENECDRSAALFVKGTEDPIGQEEQAFYKLWEYWNQLMEIISSAPGLALSKTRSACEEESLAFSKTYADLIPEQVLVIRQCNFPAYESALKGLLRTSLEDFRSYVMRHAADVAKKVHAKSESEADDDGSENSEAGWNLIESGKRTVENFISVIQGTSRQDLLHNQLMAHMLDGLKRYLFPVFKELVDIYKQEALVEIRKNVQDAVDSWQQEILKVLDQKTHELNALSDQDELRRLVIRWRRASVEAF